MLWTILLVLLLLIWIRYKRFGSVYKTDIQLNGKTFLITGGSSGLGKATAIEIAKRGARVIIASRGEEKAQKSVSEIKLKSGNSHVYYMKLDLSDLDDVRRFVQEFIEKEERLDCLVNNAGVISSMMSQNGHGKMLSINVLGPFLLTNLLLPVLKETSFQNPVRIVNVASDVYLMAELDLSNLDVTLGENATMQNVLAQYGATKLMVIYITTELNKRLRANDPQCNGITAYALHPGTVGSTTLGAGYSHKSKFHTFMRFLTFALTSRPPFYCCQTVLYCCMEDGLQSGGYYADMKMNDLWPHAKDPTVARKLWDRLEHMTGLY
uniref:dehydrogenase/reductase SDR family member 13-like n=1 Tax=Styela clava TaxID=7725 RepID=UPI00193972AA|nr:dehydrogenase/reductase SDR family member 13-like [Styela clava]